MTFTHSIAREGHLINYLGLRKNERALSQLLSWFRALKIPVEAVDPDAVGADAADLIVQNRAGCSVGYVAIRYT